MNRLHFLGIVVVLVILMYAQWSQSTASARGLGCPACVCECESAACPACPAAAAAAPSSAAADQQQIAALQREIGELKARLAAAPTAAAAAPAAAPAGAPSTHVIDPILQFVEVDDPWIVLRGRAPGALTVDVGAHVGQSAKEMSQFGHRVMSFEPYVPNCDALRKNVGEWGIADKVTLVCAGASTRAGTFDITAPEGGTTNARTDATVQLNSGESTCDPALTPATCIAAVRLDEAVKEPVLMLKIDVQGHELAVLQGAAGLFDDPARGVEIVYMETTRTDHAELAFLYERNFRCYDFPYFYIKNPGHEREGVKEGQSGVVPHTGPFHLTNGLEARTWITKERPWDVDEWLDVHLNKFSQTDVLCVKQPL